MKKQCCPRDHDYDGNCDIHPRLRGVYTRDEVPGAIPNGTRVMKCNSEETDTHQDGALCTVVGSIEMSDTGKLAYFVEWDDMKGIAVGIAAHRIKRVEQN